MDHMPRFRDRREAGRRLTEQLEQLELDRPVVLGIPRGGVVVGHEIATRLGAPLDVLVVRKLGYPGHEEAGFGAVGESGVLVPESLARIEQGEPGYEAVRAAIEDKRTEVAQRVERFRGARPRVEVSGATAIVVDDGVATGYTFAAALAIVRAWRPGRLIGAAPVASGEGAKLVADYSDELIVLGTTEGARFFAVSLYYDEFPQVSDAEVVSLLSDGVGGPARPYGA
jgi:putative phosphoribosyl transferase